MKQLLFTFEKPKAKNSPEDFEAYMKWLDKLQKTDLKAWEAELGKNYFDEED